MWSNVCFSIPFLLLDNMYEISYNAYMEQAYQLIRIWKRTHQTLRKIAAFTGESIVEALERMANEEWQHVQQQQKGVNQHVADQKDQA